MKSGTLSIARKPDFYVTEIASIKIKRLISNPIRREQPSICTVQKPIDSALITLEEKYTHMHTNTHTYKSWDVTCPQYLPNRDMNR